MEGKELEHGRVEDTRIDEASKTTDKLPDKPASRVYEGVLTIRVCRYCADPDCDNPLFCASYEPTPDDPTLETVHMDGTADEANAPLKDMWGNALFSKHTLLLIDIEGTTSSFVLHPGEQIVLGRPDNQQPPEQFLDLTAYQAHLKGVSRLHAIISQSGHTLMLTDLGSTNGTFLNEQRLMPNQPRILRDGDMIRLGHLVGYVRFR
jgi:hypothetical protein